MEGKALEVGFIKVCLRARLCVSQKASMSSSETISCGWDVGKYVHLEKDFAVLVLVVASTS